MAGKSTVAQLNVLLALDSSRMSRGIRQAQGRISVFSKAGGKAMASFGNVAAGAFAGVALAAGAAVQKAASASYEFDKVMTKMITQIGLSRKEVNSMKNDVLQMSAAYGIAASEVAQAMWTIQSGNMRGVKATHALNVASKLAAVGMGDVNTNAQTLTSTLNAYAKSGLTATEAGNIIADTIRLGQVPAENMSEVMGDLVDIASGLDIEFNQLGGTIAALSQTTTNSAKITTQLKNIMTSILNPSKEAEKLMKKLSIGFGGLRRVIAEDGLAAGLKIIKDLMEEQGDVIAGDLFPNVRGLTGILSALGDGWEKNSKIITQVGKNQNALNDAVKESNKSYSKQVDLLKNDWNNAFLSIGNAMQNSNQGVVESLRDIVNYIPKMYNVVGKALTDMINWFVDLYNNAALFKAVVEGLVFVFKTLWALVKGIATNFGSFVSNLFQTMFDPKNASKYFVDFLETSKKAFEDFKSDMEGIIDDSLYEGLFGQKDKVTFNPAEIISGAVDLPDEEEGRKMETTARLVRQLGLDIKKLVPQDVIDRINQITKATSSWVAPDQLKRWQEWGALLAGAFEGMFDAIENGESVWKSLGKMILGITRKLMAAAAAAAVLAALTGGATASGGLNFLQRFKEIAFGLMSVGALQVSERATGGRVEAGTPYIVGERGHEMFIPDHSGKIVPHGITANRMGQANGSMGLTGKVRGRDIVISASREKSFHDRYVG